MMSRTRHGRTVTVAALVLIALLYPDSAMTIMEVNPTAEQPSLLYTPVPEAKCDPDRDLPETGLQGEVPLADRLTGRSLQGYRCNMELVGSNDLKGRGVDYLSGNRQLAWYRDCGYMRVTLPHGPHGIAIIDASDPTQPKEVGVIESPVGQTHEGIHTNRARGILVVPSQEDPMRLAIYRISPNCAHPRLISIFDSRIPYGVHSGQLSPDGTIYYAVYNSLTNVEPLQGRAYTDPCLTAIDLSDLLNPRFLGQYTEFPSCHDLDVSRDGTRAYVGVYDGEDIARFVTPAEAHEAMLGTGMAIVDISDFQLRRPDPQFRTISKVKQARPHTAAVALIGGRRYVFTANEGQCANSFVRVLDVTDEENAELVADMPLEVQVTYPVCMAKDPPQDPILHYMTHYFGFDSADDVNSLHEPRNVRVLFVTSYASGLRVFDIRDPEHPREIAYYNAPVPEGCDCTHDDAYTWVRYRKKTGEIWFGGWYSGFNIVRFTEPLNQLLGR